MIEPTFRAMHLNWRYLPLEVKPDDLGAAIAAARTVGWISRSVPDALADGQRTFANAQESDQEIQFTINATGSPR